MSTRTTEQVPAGSLLAFLENWQWYRALPAEPRSLTLETAIERTAAPGEYIARAGERTTHWYGLMRGFLQMYVLLLIASAAQSTLPSSGHARVYSLHARLMSNVKIKNVDAENYNR